MTDEEFKGLPKPGDPWAKDIQPGEIQSRVVKSTYEDGSPRFLVEMRMLPKEPSGMIHGTTE